MSNAFEKLIEKHLPELNILTAAGGDIKPGSILESQEKDIVIGYLPRYLDGELNSSAVKTKECPYNIHLEKLNGITSSSGAFEIMKTLGLEFNSKKNYKIDIELKGLTSIAFDGDIGVIDFEEAISKLAKKDKDFYKRIQNHFLVFRVVYATEFRITVDVEENGVYKADATLNEINYKGKASVSKKENAILISNNTEVPLGVVCYKIKKNKLKEKD